MKSATTTPSLVSTGTPAQLGVCSGSERCTPYSGSGSIVSLQNTDCLVDQTADDGTLGTFRACVEGIAGVVRSNVNVIFSSNVNAAIALVGPVEVGCGVRIRGATAPAGDVTLTGHGLTMRCGNNVVSNVKIQDVNTAGEYHILVNGPAKNVTISRVELTSTTGDTFAANLGIVGDSASCPQGVTVQWSTIDNNHTSDLAALIEDSAACQVKSVTLHHNVFMRAGELIRVSQGKNSLAAPNGFVDVRDNILYDWNAGAKKGITVQCGSKVNFVKNYLRFGAAAQQTAAENGFYLEDTTCATLTSTAFVSANTHGDEDIYPGITATINGRGTEGQAFATPALPEHTLACIAAANAKNVAGSAASSVTLNGC